LIRVLIAAIRANRALLVLSTVGLGVAGARLAVDLTSIPWWLAVASAALLLWLSDVFRVIDSRANELSHSGRVPYRQAAIDLVAKQQVWIILMLLAAVGIGALAVILAVVT